MEPNVIEESSGTEQPLEYTKELENGLRELMIKTNPNGIPQEDSPEANIIEFQLNRSAEEVCAGVPPIWQYKKTLEQNPELRWESYNVLQDIYPGLLMNRKDVETEAKKRVSDYMDFMVSDKSLEDLKKEPGKHLGIINKPELIKNLNELELFFLIYTVDSFGENIPIFRSKKVGDDEISKLLIDMMAEKSEFIHATDFLLHKRMDKTEYYDGIENINDVYRWFCVHEQFFFGRNYYWRRLEKPRVLEFLMRTEKEMRKNGRQGLKELLNIGDWREYRISEEYYLRRFE